MTRKDKIVKNGLGLLFVLGGTLLYATGSDAIGAGWLILGLGMIILF